MTEAQPNMQYISDCADVLSKGGIAVFPTETVYGLGANALDPDAAHSIYTAKGRPADNPLIVHIAEPHEAEALCDCPPLYARLARAFMPGPLTVVLPKRDVVPLSVTGGLDTVGIRCPHLAGTLIQIHFDKATHNLVVRTRNDVGQSGDALQKYFIWNVLVVRHFYAVGVGLEQAFLAPLQIKTIYARVNVRKRIQQRVVQKIRGIYLDNQRCFFANADGIDNGDRVDAGNGDGLFQAFFLVARALHG